MGLPQDAAGHIIEHVLTLLLGMERVFNVSSDGSYEGTTQPNEWGGLLAQLGADGWAYPSRPKRNPPNCRNARNAKRWGMPKDAQKIDKHKIVLYHKLKAPPLYRLIATSLISMSKFWGGV